MTDPDFTQCNALRAKNAQLGLDSDTVDIDFHGRTLKARRGESLLATLVASREFCLRETSDGQYRGPFCGMGVCQECLVEIDGEPSQRACMTKVDKTMTVRRQGPRVHTLGQSSVSTESESTSESDVLTPQIAVIGGGPSGMTAAIHAADAGADVLLIDERSNLGGQFFKQPISASDLPLSGFDDGQFRHGRELIDELDKSGAAVMLSAKVVGAYEPLDLIVSTNSKTVLVQPQILIVATGAYEISYPFPGWTTPGVMTTGAAQTLLRSYRVLPGKRVLVAGNGPLNFQVAAELANSGVEVVAVVEAASKPSLSSVTEVAKMMASDPQLVLKGAGFLSTLRRCRASVVHDYKIATVDEVDKDGLARLRVSLKSLSTGKPNAKVFEVDTVCLGYGFRPSNEILRALGCAHNTNHLTGALETVRDENCATIRKDVLAIGDCTRLGGAPIAEAEGVLAAVTALAEVGIKASGALLRKADQMRAARRRHIKFQQALWALFEPGTSVLSQIGQSAIVCRCENLTLCELQMDVHTEGQASMASLKRSTRAGMGRCQGRYCGPVIAQLLSKAVQNPTQEADQWAPRPPIKPARIHDLARLRLHGDS